MSTVQHKTEANIEAAKHIKVLILEDSPNDAELMLLELKRAGYEPTHKLIDTPQDLTLALKSEKWDIILADYSMPSFTALDALKLLKKTSLKIPFIVVSGNIGEEVAVEMMRAGAQDYIMKDNMARLAPALERELAEAVVRLERKRAEEEARYEAETTKNLLRLSEATVKTDDLNVLMKSVVEITRNIIRLDLVMSYLWDSETNTFRPNQAAGLAHNVVPVFKTTPVRLENPVIRDALDTGRVFIECATGATELLNLQNEGLWEWVENARAISILPLVGKKEHLGFIIGICLRDSKLDCECPSEKIKALMQAVSNQVSIALTEARHYLESVSRAMELSQKIETIETMSEISRSILSTLDVHEIIEVTARMVSRLAPCDWVRVIEVDKVNKKFKFKAGFEQGSVLESIIVPFSLTSLTEVVETKRPQYIADLKTVEVPLDIESELVKRGYLSVLRTPIIVKGSVTGVLGLMSKRASAFSSGDLSTINKLSNLVGVALENARLVTDLEDFGIGTVRALAETIDAKSPWTRGHSERVTGIALRIGSEMGLTGEELKDFKIAGLLHDIGKIGTNDSILNKDGQLTDEEFSEIQEHPGKGAEILAPIKQLAHILPTIKSHHEAFDGTGYPDGLKEGEIPLQARILTVADTVDAMGANRPYRKRLSLEKIEKELKRCSGSQFDPAVVDAYLKTYKNSNNNA